MPYRKAPASPACLDSLPRILAAEPLRAVVDALVAARARRRAIVWGLGGHVIKCGLAPVLIDLMRRGYATAFALNGSAAIHDFEIALAGHTSEDVEAVLPDGRFGAAEETGREMNRAIAGGAARRLGDGRSAGPMAGAGAHPRHARRQSAAAGLPRRHSGDRARGDRHGYAAHPSGGGRGGHRRRLAPGFPAAVRLPGGARTKAACI